MENPKTENVGHERPLESRKTYTEADAAAQAETSPNIIFVGKVESKGELIDAVPPKSIQDGREKIKLPSADEQLAGFYHPKAAQIIRAFPSYKAFVKKGAK